MCYLVTGGLIKEPRVVLEMGARPEKVKGNSIWPSKVTLQHATLRCPFYMRVPVTQAILIPNLPAKHTRVVSLVLLNSLLYLRRGTLL